ncbi:MAG: hypothetical protein ACR2LR_15040 [Hassallia sp.]
MVKVPLEAFEQLFALKLKSENVRWENKQRTAGLYLNSRALAGLALKI